MLYTLAIAMLLLVLAGFIAYAGDVLGTAVGRHRLSLFGWRPKRTGQAVAMLAGILIMFTTMSILALAFQGATRTLLRAQETEQQLVQLEAEQQDLLAEIALTEAQLEAARQTILEAEGERDRALGERDTVRSDLVRLEEEARWLRENATLLQEQYRAAEEDFTLVQAEYEQTITLLNEARSSRDSALQELDEALSTRDAAIRVAQELQAAEAVLQERLRSLTVLAQNQRFVADSLQVQTEWSRALNAQLQRENGFLQSSNRDLRIGNEVLTSENAELQRNLTQVGEQLQGLEAAVTRLQGDLARQAEELLEAQRQTQRQGAGFSNATYREGETIHSGLIQAHDQAGIADEFARLVDEANLLTLSRGAGPISVPVSEVNRLIERAAASSGEDLVVFVSPQEQFEPSRVNVTVDLRENERIVQGGQLLMTHALFVNADAPNRESIRAELTRLNAVANRDLLRRGLFEGVRPVGMTEQLEPFVSALTRLSGAVEVGLVAREDIFVNGPVVLEFVILR